MENNPSLKKIILVSRKRWMRLNLIISLILLFCIEMFGIGQFHELFFLYSLWQIVAYGWMIFSELRYPGLNLISVFFVGTLLSIALPSFLESLDLLEYKKIVLHTGANVSTFLFQTSAALNIYFSLFILLLTKFTKNRLQIIDIKAIADRFNLFYLVLGVYFIATILRFVPFLESISGILANIAGNLPLLVLFLLAVYCGKVAIHDKYYKLFILLLCLEVFYNMAFGFYKGNVARVLATYFVYYYMYCQTTNTKLITKKSVLIFVGFIMVLLYVVYPFITLRRNESGFNAMADISELDKVDNVKIMKRVLTLDYEIFDDDTESAFVERMSSLDINAFFYMDAYNKGHHTDIINLSVKKLIPKFIYANKPKGSTGIMATNYLREGHFSPKGHSATSIGPFGGSYFWGGWPAVFLMCLVNSIALAILLNVCFSNLDNIFSWLFISLVIFTFMSCFKESQDGGYGADVLYLVYTLIVIGTSRILHR